MLRVNKFILCLVLGLCAGEQARAFSLLGPPEAWQVERIGYMQTGDIGAPKQPFEGYRWNLPTITYAFDFSFINYFGPKGVAAVESAIQVLNNLPPFSSITNDANNLYINGNPVPMSTRRRNEQAAALGLLDLKSWTLSMLLEEMGLAPPERYVWSLRSRSTFSSGNQTYTNYVTIMYNYDPITFRPSARVNGVTYSYDIVEYANPDVADALEVPIDPLATFAYSSVAGFNVNFLNTGDFFTGLTHDDVGGLRWLYGKNRVFTESIASNIVLVATNVSGSPWMPFFGSTNFISGTNFVSTNGIVGSSNVIVLQALRPGINKLQFKRVNYDSLVGQTFVPITNQFTDTYISNGVYVFQQVERVITQPDIVFTAGDLDVDADGFPWVYRRTTTAGWQNNDAINGQDSAVDAGPGVIQPPIVLEYSTMLPFFWNTTPSLGTGTLFIGGAGGRMDLGTRSTAAPSPLWASYDGSTNRIVIYPSIGQITVEDLQAYEVKGDEDDAGSPW